MELKQYIIDFLIDFAKILSEMAPYLLLGFFFAGLLYAFISPKNIQKYFNGKPIRSTSLASLLGIPLPLCSCGVIPTGAALYKNGASKGGTVSFLISTPQTGVDSILATFSLMGLPFALIRPIAALITGILGGLITSVFTKNENKNPSAIIEQKENVSFLGKVKQVLQYGFVDFIQDISKWLVIGLILAAIISAIVPNNFFTLLNLPPVLQMLMILIVSIPLYICATGSIPLATVLILKGISPGAAFVLLMAGPASNVATITMIGKVLGKRSLIIYLFSIIIGALSFGLIIDYVLPTAWFTNILSEHSAHQHSNELAWWQIMSGIVLTLLIINGKIQKHRKTNNNHTKNTNTMNTKTIKVDGMTCNHCKANVENSLNDLPFVKSASVNLNEKSASIEGDKLNMETIIKTIESLGYKVK